MSSIEIRRKIGIDIGTRLELITQERGVTRFWTAVRNKGVNYDDLRGTYIEIRQDGSVWHCSYRADDYLEEYQVAEGIQ